MNGRRTGSLFSGDGLLDFGLTLAGWDHAFFCESEPDRREILRLRWPGVPVYEDVREIDGSAPRIDLLAGGFPCRGASTAGARAGFDHPQTALWREMARVAGLLRPRFILIENVANLLTVARTKREPPGTAWGEVLEALAALGYVCAWDCLPAAAFGAAHLRDRVFCVAALTDGSHGLGNGSLRQGQDGRPDAEGDADQPAPDANGRPTDKRNLRAREQATKGCSVPSPHPDRLAAQPGGSERRGGGRAQRQLAAGPLGRAQSGTPTPVGWAEFEPAIRRWESAIGRPAGEPLLSGVVDGGARRVVRSRLSALGDGVQVQAGEFIGRRILKLFDPCR